MRFLEVEKSKVQRTTYNFSAFSVSPKMLEDEIRKFIPDFKPVIYEPDLRQKIAGSWPGILDCESMKKEIGISFEYDFEQTVRQLIADIKSN